MNKYEYELSICIVSWNCIEKLELCINSINKFSENINMEILICDNDSKDNTVKVLRKYYQGVKLIESNINLGFGKGNNTLFNKCRGKYILILNPDIIIVEPVFNKMISLLESKKDIAMVGCKLVNPNGGIETSFYLKFPNLIHEMQWGLFINRIRKEYRRIDNDVNNVICVDYLIAANVMVKSHILKKIEGFDERFFMYGEDIDICYRIKKLGYKILYAGNVTMFHFHGSSSKKRKKHFASVLQKESRKMFYYLNFGKQKAIGYQCILVITSYLRIIFITLFYGIYFLSGLDNDKIKDSLSKNLKYFSWGIGLQKWTKT